MDLRDRFGLRPIHFRTNSILSGRPYLVRRWGVWVDGDMVGYVRTNYEGTSIRFHPNGLATGEYLIDEEAETAEALAGA